VTVRPFPILLALTLGLFLGGCSASQDSASSSGSAAAPAAADQRAAGQKVADAGSLASGTAPKSNAEAQTSVAAAGARRVRTAQLPIEVKQLPTAAARVRAAAEALGGVVSAETSSFPSAPGDGAGAKSDAAAESVITVRVPEPRLDDALNRIAAVGHELNRSATSQDVTASIADLNSRVSSQTRSVARIRDLMDRAKSLQDVVLLESELSKREADLESIQAQQRVLSDQADLATITVTLHTPDSVVATTTDDDGFLAGLRQGWHAVAASTTVVLTVLGALLPVAIVLTLLGWPGYLLFRRLRPRPATPPPATP
jgi:hypothetical protein